MSFQGFSTQTTSLFGGGQNTFGSAFGQQSTIAAQSHNPMKDAEVASAPSDSISALAFSPLSLPQNYLIAGSWDNSLRCWEVHSNGAQQNWQTIPKAQQTHQAPVLDVAWSDVSISTRPFWTLSLKSVA